MKCSHCNAPLDPDDRFCQECGRDSAGAAPAPGAGLAVAGSKILTVGRERDNDIIVSDPKVSRHQARILIDGGGNMTIEDVGAVNGVFVNGTRTQRSAVRFGDQVRFGSVPFDLGLVRPYLGAGPAIGRPPVPAAHPAASMPSPPGSRRSNSTSQGSSTVPIVIVAVVALLAVVAVILFMVTRGGGGLATPTDLAERVVDALGSDDPSDLDPLIIDMDTLRDTCPDLRSRTIESVEDLRGEIREDYFRCRDNFEIEEPVIDEVVGGEPDDRNDDCWQLRDTSAINVKAKTRWGRELDVRIDAILLEDEYYLVGLRCK